MVMDVHQHVYWFNVLMMLIVCPHVYVFLAGPPYLFVKILQDKDFSKIYKKFHDTILDHTFTVKLRPRLVCSASNHNPMESEPT